MRCLFVKSNSSTISGSQVMSLLSHFCRRIRLTGPLNIGELMQDVIMDPKHGYYPQVNYGGFTFHIFIQYQSLNELNISGGAVSHLLVNSPQVLKTVLRSDRAV